MRARKLLPLFLATLSLTILAGCGGMSSNAGPPRGNFSNSSLSGTYAFAFSGSNLATGVFFTMAGSLQANGSGTITGGTIDINSPGSAVPILTNAPLTGTYIVHPDGRGFATLMAAGAPNNVNIDFVLFSNQHAAVIRFDNFATASGSLDMQSSSAFNLAALAGNLVFNISGIDSSGAPEASAGVFTVTSSGAVTSGVQDTSVNGTLFTGGGVGDTLTAGALNPPSNSNGRGTMSLTSTALGSRNFAFYIVSANQIRLIEIDSAPVLAGDAFQQGSTSISGSFAFTNSGANATVPFAEGGILNTDGAGNVLNSSVEDVNNGGTISTNVTLSGTYAVAGNGRGMLNLNSGTINFAIYPSTGGIQLLEIDNNTVTSGTAFQQSGSFSNSTISGRYGANVTGVTSTGAEFDAVYQFTANGNGALTGAQDINVGGVLSANLAFNGVATLAPNGRASAVGKLNTVAGNLSVIHYAVNSTRILFIGVDNNAVAVGSFSQQQ
jgi:hypothetical protein